MPERLEFSVPGIAEQQRQLGLERPAERWVPRPVQLADGAEPVAVDIPDLQRRGYRIVLDNLLEEHGVIRHNPKRLALLLLEEFLSHPRRQ